MFNFVHRDRSFSKLKWLVAILDFQQGQLHIYFPSRPDIFFDPDMNLSSVPCNVSWKYNDKSRKLTFHLHLLRGLRIHGARPPLPVLRHRDTFYQILFFCMAKFPVWEVAAESRDYVVSRLCCHDVRSTRVCTWLPHFCAKCFSPLELSSRAAIQTVIELNANYACYLIVDPLPTEPY